MRKLEWELCCWYGGMESTMGVFGLVGKGGGSDGGCCYAGESPWVPVGSTRGRARPLLHNDTEIYFAHLLGLVSGTSLQ